MTDNSTNPTRPLSRLVVLALLGIQLQKMEAEQKRQTRRAQTPEFFPATIEDEFKLRLRVEVNRAYIKGNRDVRFLEPLIDGTLPTGDGEAEKRVRYRAANQLEKMYVNWAYSPTKKFASHIVNRLFDLE